MLFQEIKPFFLLDVSWRFTVGRCAAFHVLLSVLPCCGCCMYLQVKEQQQVQQRGPQADQMPLQQQQQRRRRVGLVVRCTSF